MNWDELSCKTSQLKVLSLVNTLEWGKGSGSIFVYYPLTSIEMSITSFGNFVFSATLMKSVVPLR